MPDFDPAAAAAAEPRPELFPGHSFTARLRRAWFATRPQYLTASALPVVVGTAWGVHLGGSLRLADFVLALLGVALLHAASNVWNDVGDEQCGSDPANTDRIYPFTGGSRFIQNGVLSEAQMLQLTLLLAGAALAVGLLLFWRHGLPVLVLGLLGAACGGLYSWPRVQLAGRGLGEFVVALAFGVLPVIGAAWLQQPVFDAATIWLALPVSAWVAAILLINEVPDRQADSQAGKRTLPVRLGISRTGWLYAGLQLLALVGTVAWQQSIGASPWPLVFFLLLALPGLRIGLRLSASRAALAVGIRQTLALHAGGCAALIAWVLLLA